MKKIVSLFILLIMLNSQAYATENKFKEAGEYLKSIGIIKGQDSGDLNIAANVTREQAIVVLIRAMGVEQEAKLIPTKNMLFKDVDSNNFYASYIEYARLKGWTKGIDGTEFGFGKLADKNMMASFLVRSLRYSGLDYAEEFELSKKIGIFSDLDSDNSINFTRGQMFVMLDNALSKNMNGSNITLLQSLGLQNKSNDFKIVNIESNNLKEISFEFNKPISSNIQVGRIGVVPIIRDYKLVLENEGRILKLVNQSLFKQNSEYAFKLGKIKSKSSEIFDTGEIKIKIVDNELPKVEKIYSVGNKIIAIKFSELMDKSIKGKVDLVTENTKLSISSNCKFDDNDSSIYYVNLNEEIDSSMQYKIRIRNFADYAGNIIIDTLRDYTHKRAISEGNASIGKITAEYVEIKFDTRMINLTKEHFYHRFKDWNAIGIYKTFNGVVTNNSSDRVKKDDFVDTVWVRFANGLKDHPLVPDNESIFIKSKANGIKIKDAWGNTFSDIELKASMNIDREEPKVIGVEFQSPNLIIVSFNKPIDEKTVNSSNIKVTDLSGKKIKSMFYTVKLSEDFDSKVEIKVSSSNIQGIIGKQLLVKVQNISDATAYSNKMKQSYSKSVEFLDAEFSQSLKAVYENSEKKLMIQFGESVDSNASLPSNYMLQLGSDKHNITSENVQLMEDRVIFFLNDEDVSNIEKPNVKLIVSNKISDLYGNTWNSFEKIVNIQKNGGSSPCLTMSESKYDVYSVSENKILLQFDQVIKTLNLNEFKISISDASKNLNPIEGNIKENNSVGSLVELVFEPKNENGKVYSFLHYENIKLSYQPSGDDFSTVNNFGKSPKEFNNIEVLNKIPVKIAYMNMFMYSGVEEAYNFILQGSNPHIAIMYSGKIKTPSIESFDVYVNGSIREIDKITTNGYVLNIFLKKKLKFGEMALIYQKRPIYAQNGTEIKFEKNGLSAYAIVMDIDESSLEFSSNKMILRLATDIPESSLEFIDLNNAFDASKELINGNTIIFTKSENGKSIKQDDRIVIKRGFRFSNGLYVEPISSNVNAIKK